MTNTENGTIIQTSKKVKVKIKVEFDQSRKGGTDVARLVDVIELMIKEMLDENNGKATISRSDLAERANCVPSQITYVLSTRFSSGNGYIVESRRGGGGQITIRRAKIISKGEYLQSVLNAVGNDLTQQQAKIYLTNLVSSGAISPHEATVVMATVSDRALVHVDSDIRSVVRADIFKNALVSLMLDGAS